MEFDKIITLIQTVDKSSLTQFTIKEGDFKISMEKSKQTETIKADAAAPAENLSVENVVSSTTSVSIEKPDQEIPSGNIMKAPLVGTFYHAASPDASPFVRVGDAVKKGQTLGIVEAMKLMNEIESEFDGVVEAILVENESVVEYGQPLFIIK